MNAADWPTVSLVMPVWQPRVDWLHAAVASALSQEGCNLELIIVDDGNDKPIAELLLGNGDPRLRVMRIAHGGAYAARNAGLSVARGQWIRFVDCDDVLERRSTARLLQLIDNRDDIIAYGSTMVCDEELRPLRKISSDVQGRADEACIVSRFDVRIVSMLFPRRVLTLAGDWDPSFSISGDWDYVLRTLEHALVRGDPSPATYYRRHHKSLTKLADVAEGEEAWRRILAGYFERHPDKRGSELERRTEQALLVDRAAAYAHAGDLRRALSRLARLARVDAAAAVRLSLILLRREVAARLDPRPDMGQVSRTR